MNTFLHRYIFYRVIHRSRPFEHYHITRKISRLSNELAINERILIFNAFSCHFNFFLRILDKITFDEHMNTFVEYVE